MLNYASYQTRRTRRILAMRPSDVNTPPLSKTRQAPATGDAMAFCTITRSSILG
jgi:hypothetical protein